MSSDEIKRRPAKGPRVAVAQIAPALGDVEANLVRHRRAVEQAAEEGVDILVFPELSLTGYRLKDTVPEVAATRSGPVFEELARLSRGVTILVGLVEETDEHHFYNAAVLFEAGRLVASHRKVYLPTYGMFDEQRYFARGHRIVALPTRFGRVAALICEDMLHPSAMTIAALDGAAIIFVPSSSPARGVTNDGEIDANGRHWENYNRTMARNTGVYVVYANRVGVEDGQTFWGGSEIIDPSGQTLAKAAYYDEDFVSAVLPDDAIRARRIQYPVLRDEDLDLTINELMRLRQRPRERRDAGERGRGSWQDRGGRRDRGREGRDDRGREGRDDRGREGRDDRGREGWDDRGRRDRRRGGWEDRSGREGRGAPRERGRSGWNERGRDREGDRRRAGRGGERGDASPPPRYRDTPAERGRRRIEPGSALADDSKKSGKRDKGEE